MKIHGHHVDVTHSIIHNKMGSTVGKWVGKWPFRVTNQYKWLPTFNIPIEVLSYSWMGSIDRIDLNSDISFAWHYSKSNSNALSLHFFYLYSISFFNFSMRFFFALVLFLHCVASTISNGKSFYAFKVILRGGEWENMPWAGKITIWSGCRAFNYINWNWWKCLSASCFWSSFTTWIKFFFS